MSAAFKINWLLFIVLLLGCKREEPTTWTPAIKAPIARGTLGLGELLNNDMLYLDDNDIWHLHIERNLTNFQIDSLVQIPDTTIHKKLDLPFLGGPFNIPAGTELYNQTQNNVIQTQGAELTSIDVSGGSLLYSFRSYVNGALSCTCTLPGATLNGNAIELIADTPPCIDDSNPSVASGIIALTNYHIDLTGTNGNSYNQLVNLIHVQVDDDASAPAQVYGSDSVVIDLTFVDATVRYARGYFGQHAYAFSENITLGANFQLPAGQLNLDGAQLDFVFKNYVGADMQMNLNALVGQQNNNAVSLEYIPFNQWLNLSRAIESNSGITPTTLNYNLNSSNSNLDDFLGNLPHQLQLNANVIINPLGNVSLNNDFIATDHTIDAIATMDIPLRLASEEITFLDTIELTNEAIDLMANGTLKLVLDNYFPFEVDVHAVLINGGNQNTLLNHSVLLPHAGDPDQSQRSVWPIDVTNEIIQGLRRGSKIVLQLGLATPNYPQLQTIYQWQRVDYILIADTEVQLQYD
jgi:hypothetical protein